MDDIAHLDALQDELSRAEWTAKAVTLNDGPGLHVAHPHVSDLNGDVICKHGEFRWHYGDGLGPALGSADDVQGVAARIRHVLRAVGS